MYLQGQLFLPFKELQGIEPYPERHNATIQFRIKKQVKDELSVLAKSRNLSITRLLNDIIGRYITGGNQKAKRQIGIGRSHVNTVLMDKVKDYLRKNPGGASAVDLANYAGCSNARVVRVLDLLSKGTGFLVYEEGIGKNTRYFMY